MLWKDVFLLEEIQFFINCYYENENLMVRCVFIFCLYCGLCFCDVKDFIYKNVDYLNKLLKFEQNKIKGYFFVSGVVIFLNDGLFFIIGEVFVNGNKDVFIFDLLIYESCFKLLRCQVKRVGIDKYISWYCVCYLFVVNIFNNGVNIKIVVGLFGYSGLKYMKKYICVVDKLKEEVINSLFELKF